MHEESIDLNDLTFDNLVDILNDKISWDKIKDIFEQKIVNSPVTLL